MQFKNKTVAMATAMICVAGLPSWAWAFQEAPMLTEMVEAGTLPPVEERLPVNPTVVNAVEVGSYGGSWQRAYKGPGDRWGPTKLMEERVLKWRMSADDTAELVPGYIESYSVNEDSSAFTFTLLEGLKWSDGVPVTTEDVRFWYEDIFLNEAIVPTIDPTFAPGGTPMKVEIADERTFTVSFEQPYVYFLQILAKDSTGEPSLDRPSFLFPKHYLSQFNNKYASEEELAAAAAEFNVETWRELWGSKGAATGWWQNTELPVITAWRMKTPAPAEVVVMERNPYYYAVDQEGNQLPYIDRIEHRLFQEAENLNLMIAQGQISMQGRYISSADYTFYRENEERGGYSLKTGIGAGTWAMMPNLNVKDEVLRELYETDAFREALSISIDRELINELAFSALAEPRQVSPISGSPYFNAELEQYRATYEPDRANALLDEIGLTERDGAGYRVRSDGQRLAIVIEGNNAAYSDVLELLTDNMADVGVELLVRIIDRTQWDNNRDNNDFQMQWIGFDRLSVVSADPRRMMGWDGFANQYFVWYNTDGESGIEPPQDHGIREIYALWDEASQAATIEAADKAVNALIAKFITEGWVIGVVGEEPAFFVVSDSFKNMRNNVVMDDILRSPGNAQPQQMWIAQ